MTDRLPPTLLKLFAPRPMPMYLPPLDVEPGERRCRKISPIANFMSSFTENSDLLARYIPTETDEQKKLKRVENRVKEKQLSLKRQQSEYNPQDSTGKTEDPYKTLFISRLPENVTDDEIIQIFREIGPIRSVKRVSNTLTKKPRSYCFIEFEEERHLEGALERSEPFLLKGNRLILDVERGRTVKGWKPKRLGGGVEQKKVKESSTVASRGAPREPENGRGNYRRDYYGKRPGSPRNRSPGPYKRRR